MATNYSINNDSDSDEEVNDSDTSFINVSRRKSMKVRRSIYAQKLENSDEHVSEEEDEDEFIVSGSDDENLVEASASDSENESIIIRKKKKNHKNVLISSDEEEDNNDSENKSDFEINSETPEKASNSPNKSDFEINSDTPEKSNVLSDNELASLHISESSDGEISESFDYQELHKINESSKVSESIQSFGIKENSAKYSESTKMKESSSLVLDSSKYDKSLDPESSTHKFNSTKNSDRSFDLKIRETPTNDSKSSNRSSVIILDDDDDDDNEIIKPQRKLIQPKITMFTPSKQQPTKKIVTQTEYDTAETERKNSLIKLSSLRKLLQSHGPNLPDKGETLQKQILACEKKLEHVIAELSSMEVNDQHIQQSKPNPFKQRNSWDDIQAAANFIQPKHTGERGLNTFNTQKTLTVDRLRQLHNSLETCPTDDMLADQPKGLIVNLMKHQLKAIKWMHWREKQAPKGGILADDMGLGKTLTTIALVLSKLEVNKEEQSSSSDDDDSDKENTGRNRSTYYGGTLIVCPASLINQWQAEVKQRIKRNLINVCVHHGSNRETKSRKLAKFDMVVTTYAIVKNERAENAALFGIKWERIVLDEAHIIRNHKTAQAEACFLLRGKYRWSLTGTPIQNKESDIYSQLRFLRCTPFDDIKVYKQWIGNSNTGSQERLNSLIQPLLLRRTKQQLNEKGELGTMPNKSVNIVSVTLEKEEMNVYQKVMAYSKTLFSQFLNQREKQTDIVDRHGGTNYYDEMHRRLMNVHGAPDVQQHQILTLILRLRQICIHPGLIEKMLEDGDSESDYDEEADIDLLAHLNRLNLNDDNQSSNMNEVETAKASSKILHKTNPVYDFDRASSKFKTILELVNKIVDSNDKVVVVSQFTSVLNVLGKFLEQEHIKYCKLTGSVLVKFRNDIVVDFNNSSSRTKVMLLSLTAGGVGLNLIGGNHLIIMDPHWNPQLELQAQDRVFRIGQNKEVFIYKVLCHDTIEERIKTLQDKKLSIASDMLAGVKRTTSSKLTIDDMKSLFGIN